MFDVLLESARKTDRFLWSRGSVGSAVAHAVLIGAAIAATAAGGSLAPEGLTETVVYLAPPKREPVTPDAEQLVYRSGGDARALVEGISAALADGALIPLGGRGAGAAETGSGHLMDRDDFMPALMDDVAPAFTIVQVDSVAQRDPASEAPAYPQSLLRNGIQGATLVQFVVDSTGSVDLRSFRAIHATSPLFTLAVYGALPRMRYRPATIGGRPVRQLVQQEFRFQIVNPRSNQAM